MHTLSWANAMLLRSCSWWDHTCALSPWSSETHDQSKVVLWTATLQTPLWTSTLQYICVNIYLAKHLPCKHLDKHISCKIFLSTATLQNNSVNIYLANIFVNIYLAKYLCQHLHCKTSLSTSTLQNIFMNVYFINHLCQHLPWKPSFFVNIYLSSTSTLQNIFANVYLAKIFLCLPCNVSLRMSALQTIFVNILQTVFVNIYLVNHLSLSTSTFRQHLPCKPSLSTSTL